MLKKICNKEVKRGEKNIVKIHVTKDLGVDITITAHVLAGKHEGPTLLILSMLHGEEWFSALIVRELVKRINLDELHGTIIAVPVANVSSFNTGTRCLIDNSDEPDANRAFDGKLNWMSNQITRKIEEELMSKSDYMIDYHVGGWGARMADIGYGADYANSETTQTSKGMAIAYGFPVLHAMTLNKGTHSSRTSMGCAGIKYNIPAIIPEIGGLGFGEKIEAQWIEENLNGIFGNLKFLKMMDGSPEFCEKYLKVGDYFRISPKNGGYIELAISPSDALTEVKRGQLLARVVDPETFEILEELTSPCDGVIFYGCRNYMARPGGWVFGIANVENNISQWLKHDQI